MIIIEIIENITRIELNIKWGLKKINEMALEQVKLNFPVEGPVFEIPDVDFRSYGDTDTPKDLLRYYKYLDKKSGDIVNFINFLTKEILRKEGLIK